MQPDQTMNPAETLAALTAAKWHAARAATAFAAAAAGLLALIRNRKASTP